MSKCVRPSDGVFVVLKADVQRETGSYLKDLITVEAVFRSREQAAREVVRLNLARDPGSAVEYWAADARLFGDGGACDDEVDPA